NKSPPPDIYFIILDGYGRSDAVENVEGVDNSAFLNNLQQLGFYVARCSQSNYTRTLLSLASAFNMEYVQALNTQLTPNQDTAWLVPYLKHSLVRQQLEQLGYKTIVFKNPWEAWVWDDAAIVYRSSGRGLLPPFEYLLLSTTVMRIYLDRQQAGINQLANYTNYEDTLYTLDQLQNVPKISGPKLVFVHLVIPHPPFVFGSDGEHIDIPPYDTVSNLYTDEDYRRGYTAAVAYIDKRMLEILPRLIQDSDTPPVIILAGDHGIGESDTVTQNLEAFYAPGVGSNFYAQITPVNIFRVVFDVYFNGNFSLLPDHSYFSAEGKYFNFKEIPNGCMAP
ncbi:MAG TPA: sulfatase-like hydrolase/transferase, partial [Anaerolineales bacterium]